MVPNGVLAPPRRCWFFFHTDAELPSEHPRRVVAEECWNEVQLVVEIEGVRQGPFVDVDFDFDNIETSVFGQSESLEEAPLLGCI